MKIEQKLLFILVICLFGGTSASLRQAPFGSRDTKDIAKIVADLKVAKTHVDRIAILDNNSDFVFDFFAAIKKTSFVGKGGRAVGANANSFPAVIENNLAMTVGVINSCGINPPHSHPRAAEFSLAVNGTFEAGFIAENGARTVTTTLQQGQAILIPKGAMHWVVNLGCETVMFVGAFNHEDPGVLPIAPNFFGISEDVVSATLGGLDPKKIEAIKKYIPDNIILGLQECLKKCDLERKYYEDYSGDASYSGADATYDDDEPPYDADDDDDGGTGY
jgi:quercetin dioxygenase-like cupin family protein